MNQSTSTTLPLPLTNTALALGFTGALGNIDAYISAVNRLPILSQEEETRLATELRDQNNLAAAQQLVMSRTSVCAG